MAVTAKWYGNAPKNAFLGKINYTGHDIYVMLLTDLYTPDQDTHEFVDDVSANEVEGTGYTAGGKLLTGKTLTYDAPTNTLKFDANDPTWTESTIEAHYAVIYDGYEALEADQPILGYVNFGENRNSNNGEFKIQWHANGVLKGVTAL